MKRNVERIDIDLDINFTSAQIDEILTSEYLIDQGLIRYFNSQNQSNLAVDVCELMANRHQAVIVERIHDYSLSLRNAMQTVSNYFNWNDQPKTAYLFISPSLSGSFGVHFDLEHVYLYCTEGIKTMEVEVNGEFVEYLLNKGEGLFIPKGVRHKATNQDTAVSVSFGLETYLENQIREYSNAAD